MAAFSTENRDAFKNGGGTVASLFAGIGSYFATTHKLLAFVLAAIGIVFLIVTVCMHFTRRSSSSGPTYGLIALSVIMFGFYGYRDLHEPATASTVTTTQQGSTVINSATSSHDYAPAVAGSGNVVNYGTPPPAARKKHK